jgi:putative transposase
MPNYRRFYFPGGTYFFTIVTCNRYPFFNSPIARRILLASCRLVEHEMPFKLFAWAVMPEHLHAVVTLPRGDCDFSTRIKKLKKSFSESWLASGGHEEPISESRKRKKERGIWQRRYYEHLVQDEIDLENHVDYIHFNPVKHELVQSPNQWRWTSFQRFVKAGQYSIDWGRQKPENLKDFFVRE